MHLRPFLSSCPSLPSSSARPALLTSKGDLLKERKYFDSGDYALSKAGKASDVGVTTIGSRHPVPENIPHLTATSPPQGNHHNGHGLSTHPGHNGFGRSPVKEGSFLRRSSAEGTGMTPDIGGASSDSKSPKSEEKQGGLPEQGAGLPIRR
jgi:hypothetical protein